MLVRPGAVRAPAWLNRSCRVHCPRATYPERDRAREGSRSAHDIGSMTANANPLRETLKLRSQRVSSRRQFPELGEAAFHRIPQPILLLARHHWASPLGSPRCWASLRRSAHRCPQYRALVGAGDVRVSVRESAGSGPGDRPADSPEPTSPAAALQHPAWTDDASWTHRFPIPVAAEIPRRTSLSHGSRLSLPFFSAWSTLETRGGPESTRLPGRRLETPQPRLGLNPHT